MTDPDRPILKGHGSHINPPDRFFKVHYEPDPDRAEPDAADGPGPPTEYIPDHARSTVTENARPDVGSRYSLTPYRGCLHGCAYCYARPTHEYLGYSAGLDFETKILVKAEAPGLFRNFLARDAWVPEPI